MNLKELFDYIISGYIFISLTAITIIHWYWAFGGEKGFKEAVPHFVDTDSMKAAFSPGRISTFLVSFIFLFFSILPFFHFKNSDIVIYVVSLLFLIRAIGDFKYLGFFKKIKNTIFAKRDTLLYAPLSLSLSISYFMLSFIRSNS